MFLFFFLLIRPPEEGLQEEPWLQGSASAQGSSFAEPGEPAFGAQESIRGFGTHTRTIQLRGLGFRVKGYGGFTFLKEFIGCYKIGFFINALWTLKILMEGISRAL